MLHVDNDVDMMPVELVPELVAERWLTMVPTLLRARREHQVDGQRKGAPGQRPGLRLLGMPDHATPLNGGLLLLRPSATIFADGMRVLRRCRFNQSHGWELVGPPRAVRARGRYFSPRQGGSTYSRPLSRKVDGFWITPQADIMAYKDNNWRFVAADSDQGFIWYMLFIRHDLGACA